jgi:signal peptidase II
MSLIKKMKISFKILLFCLVCFACISCDRVTKDLAKEHLKNQQPISYFHDTVRLEYVENTGAALSLGDNLPKSASFWLLSILPLAFLAILFAYTIRNASKMSAMKVFSLALLFSGGIGNIIDRILFDRHVTDFMNLGIQNIRTGIFNVADICVTAGAIGLLLFFRDRQQVEPITESL